MKKNLLLSIIIASLLFVGCEKNEAIDTTDTNDTTTGNFEETVEVNNNDTISNEIVILYTNDVHTYIDNNIVDENGDVTTLLTYASVAAYRDELIKEGKNVILVDAGDHSSGTAYGGLDEGHSVIEIMNAVGYDLATLGNHEFDYGQFRAFEIMEDANFPYISCNFYNVNDNSLVLPASKIFEFGDCKIAFIGISTPETIHKSSSVYFCDENGNYIYNFYSGEDGSELYDAVQNAIDEIRDDVDYVIAIGHLGVDIGSTPYRSIDVIENVSGLDAFIDGHSHTIIESELVKDASGNEVLLSQTGSYLGAIGKLTISTDGILSTELISEYKELDEEVDDLTKKWVNIVDEKLGEKIAYLDCPLYITDPSDDTVRIIRRMETNLGDFSSDAIYYYFNDVLDVNCDVAITNGGGLRSGLETGDITYLSAKMVNPFGNVMCMVEATGQDIIDALELETRYVGVKNPDTDEYAENGGYIHVSGLTFKVNTIFESEVVTDENNGWKEAPENYRVYDVCIYNKETCEYEPIDPHKLYTIAGSNYMLRNNGDGLTMFSNNNLFVDYVSEDYLVMAEYFKAFETKEDGIPHINSANSPLRKYENFLIDYENPYGSGRILYMIE